MPRLTPKERWKLSALRNAERRELIKSSIRERWFLVDWDATFPWWREPSLVRILIYGEGFVAFENGLFGGMIHVTTLLQARPYFYVDFEITTAHRTNEFAGASVPGKKKLTELNILNNFDEIWFFGYSEVPPLDDAEIQLLNTFMSAPYYGGVLVTGDHRDRGKSIAGSISRAGKMRKYPSPDVQLPERNSSLVEGSDPNTIFDFNDQSDDVAQTISLARFPSLSVPGFKSMSRPHPILCTLDGPIDVLPDHQHEGQAAAPSIAACDEEWPQIDEHQEQPVVIARSRTKEPGAENREFDVLSAYDGHNVNVGRIVADASWHHWFDVNLTGIPASPVYRGFDVSPEGRESLRKIDAYFLNCGAWLAPPAKQSEMRHAAWWAILWTDQVAELSPDLPLYYLGEQALSALRVYASDCAAADWVLGIPSLKNMLSKNDFAKLSEPSPDLNNVSLEQYVAGGILRTLMTEIGPFKPEIQFPFEAPSDDVLEKLIDSGMRSALSSLK